MLAAPSSRLGLAALLLRSWPQHATTCILPALPGCLCQVVAALVAEGLGDHAAQLEVLEHLPDAKGISQARHMLLSH